MKTSNYSAALVFGKIFYRGFHGWKPRCFLSVPSGPSVVEFLWLRLIVCIFFGLTGSSANAQIQQAWVARYNNGITNGTNQAVKMALDPVGNIYVTAFSQNANSNLGYVTIKYAPNGNQLWATRYDSTNYPAATPAALALDGSNNVFVTGSALTIKYDPSGNALWTAPYAGSALAVDSNANVYVAGFSQNFGTVKLSPQGSNVWLTTYTESYGPTVSQAVLVDSANNVYVSGLDSYYSFVENGVTNAYVTLTTIKYEPNGNQIWKASEAPVPEVSNVQVTGSAFDNANNLYMVANYYTSYGYFALKYASNGNLNWTWSFGETGAASGLSFAPASNIVLTGRTPRNYPNYAYCTATLDANGSTVWISYYPQAVFRYPQSPVYVSTANAIATDSANNAYVTGYSPGTNSGNDIVTIKYGPNGNQVWLQRYHGPGNGNDAGNAIAVDNKGNVYVTGYETTAAGGTEMVTIKYAPVTLQRRSDGTVLLQAQGLAGESFDFQGSTDLMNWLDLGSALADSNGLAQFEDTNASNYNWRFYITSPQ
jgi:hypothetical protein